MENPFLQTEELNVFSYNTDKRIERILDDGSNVHHIFYSNYINFSILQYKNYYSGTNKIINPSVNYLYDKFIKSELRFFDNSFINELTLLDRFLNNELESFNNYVEPKAIIYKNFINQNTDKFKAIDQLILNHLLKKYFLNFKEYAQERLNVKLFDIDNLSRKLDLLFMSICRYIVYDLIVFNEISTELNLSLQPENFNIDELISPTDLLKNGELQTYRQTLHEWIEYADGEIKKKYTPLFQYPLLEYIKQEIKNSLNPNVDSTNNSLIIPNEILENNNDYNISIKYPEYIFRDQKSFLLFKTIASNIDSHPDISFLYRQMNEIEKPKMIKVNQNIFIEWFNQENFALKEIEKFKTLHQSDKGERKKYYEIIKSLIFRN